MYNSALAIMIYVIFCYSDYTWNIYDSTKYKLTLLESIFIICFYDFLYEIFIASICLITPLHELREKMIFLTAMDFLLRKMTKWYIWNLISHCGSIQFYSFSFFVAKFISSTLHNQYFFNTPSNLVSTFCGMTQMQKNLKYSIIRDFLIL